MHFGFMLGFGAAQIPAAAPATYETLFDHSTVTVAGVNEIGSQLTLGVVFSASIDGTIAGIYFFKTSGDTATSRTAALFDNSGATITTGTSSGEPDGPGWVLVSFASPQAIVASTFYRGGVFFPNGGYPAEANVFASSVTRGHLTAPDFTTADGNGCFNYDTHLTSPVHGASGTSYGIDIAFKGAS